MEFNGNIFCKEFLAQLKQRVAALPFVPEFCDILIGEDIVSAKYVRMKQRVAEQIGISFVETLIPSSSTTEEILERITLLRSRPNMCGIIVQLPLPGFLDTQRIVDALPLSLDVDGLSTAYDDVFYNTSVFDDMVVMPTASAVMKILESCVPGFSQQKIVVIGKGKLVGKPVTHLLESLGSDVSVITLETDVHDRAQLLRNADVVISAVGQPGVLAGRDIRSGIAVIDAGTLEVDGEIRGDIDYESVSKKSTFITPTPNGVGPVTVACLMENVVKVAEKKALDKRYE